MKHPSYEEMIPWNCWKHTEPPEPPTTHEAFVKAVYDTIKRWIHLHTDRYGWAENWLAGQKPTELLNETPTIKTGYFEIHFLEKVRERWAEQNFRSLLKCPECGMIGEIACCDCEEEGETPEWVDVTQEELADWSKEMEWPESFDNSIVAYTFITDVWEAYYENTYEAFCVLLGDMQEMTEEYDKLVEQDAELSEMLVWATWAMHAEHVGTAATGNKVWDDYGPPLWDSEWHLDNLQNSGLEAMLEYQKGRATKRYADAL